MARLPFNLGYGAALQTGYKFALRQNVSCVVQMDADGQHDPTQIERLTDDKVVDNQLASDAFGWFPASTAHRLEQAVSETGNGRGAGRR